MAKSMSLLWGAGSPPCWRVMITLEEKKLQGYRRKLLSVQAGEQRSPEVLELNPRGQLPAFKHGDHVLNELSVIRYPKLTKYYSLLKGRASIKASWPPHWLEGHHGYVALKDL
ncbi:hypothetical protein CRUP_033751 [Coryphaenoides rupestris]|nr:hypothetical protein CRUP_033751 [Coryphaenoides rupestris]